MFNHTNTVNDSIKQNLSQLPQPEEDRSLVQSPPKATARARVSEKIRSELNIEKWPAIWQPAKSKNKPSVRTLEREFSANDGSRVVSRVEVGYTQLGTLTTEEQKMLYVLIKLWEDSGKPDAQVFFSSRGLARLLKKKGWGSNVIEAITKSLRKLRTIPIEWINSYYDRTKAGAVVVDRRPITFLGDLRIVERQQDGAVNSSLGYFKFNDHILSNLQLNYTKPVCIDEFFKLKSEIAQLIYSHVDLMLFDKNKYERRSRELFDDLGLKNPEYNHMYERRRAIERALKELSGIRLSSGVLKSGTIEKTADGKDYKVSFSKGATARVDTSLPEEPPRGAVDAIVVNDYSKRKDDSVLKAEELVRYFHEVFHGVSNHSPQSKETGQAATLVSQYGLDAAKFIVEFASSEAETTNFKVAHFGAVLNYVSRALTAFGKERNGTKASQLGNPVPHVPPSAEERFIRAEARLAMLTAEQLEARLAQAKAELFAQNRFFAQHFKPGHKTLEEMIRRRVVRQMEHEPMDLLVVDNEVGRLIAKLSNKISAL